MTLKCAGYTTDLISCGDIVTMIDNRGYVYCTKHGEIRKKSLRYYRIYCRKLTKKELSLIMLGQAIAYRKGKK